LRMCPGFAIARVEITNAQLKAAGISRHGDRACPLPADGHADAPAACVTAQEMEADVEWLSQHIGRSYRLPSAAALEFAARASVDDDRGADRMGGGLAEMVAECWPSDVPATQVLAVDFSETQITRCSHRIVKDGADDEREHCWRLSARRAFDAAARSPTHRPSHHAHVRPDGAQRVLGCAASGRVLVLELSRGGRSLAR
jgi:formylglycine-generating enzyme required for sulfatase activity